MSTYEYIRLTDAVGRPNLYTSIDQARWEFRHRHQNGLADAFRRVGRRILVSPTRRAELLAQQPAA